ncbi:carboxymuconolactone decarboxylase family protein [Flagellimonas sp. S3867]|uniref:carboxymuconolactone decarboxylase family protein n=1 Tax=Flagellimonas sp. S3867 TaxID=2768063 RepID=UPI00168282DD|nr:peroxidase-related enzyme [Flagellimonas sp. S3867]
MSWIKVIEYEHADPQLKRIYDRVKGPNNNIDNVLSIHSLRPHSLVGHMTLYKNVLHNSNNELPKWYLEAIGIYVSHLNKCDYCVQHHFEGFKRLLNDAEKAQNFMQAVTANELNDIFEKKYLAGMEYAKKLTLAHTTIAEQDIDDLRAVSFTDGQILEINQVSSYFNYVNRTVLGLGVSTKGDILGLSPNESADPSDWSHK